MHTCATALIALAALVGLAGCGGDWSYDDSFTWGTGLGTTAGIHATGIVGSGEEPWQHGDFWSSGNSDQWFDGPTALCLDGAGDIYVADQYNHRICRWSKDGLFQGYIGGGSSTWRAGPASTTGGSDNYSFDDPRGVFVDGSGYIYVADYGNDRVCKWTGEGDFVGWIGQGLSGWQTGTPGFGGSDFGELNAPRGLFVDTAGTIFVCDSFNDRIHTWDANGVPLGWIGGGLSGWQVGSNFASGSDWTWFDSPYGIAVDKVGDIYVADSDNHRISRWDRWGFPQGWIGQGQDGWQNGSGIIYSDGPKYFHNPYGVFIDQEGLIYVADYSNNRISKWNRKGIAQGWFGDGKVGWSMDAAGFGSSQSQGFSNPSDIFLDGNGMYYIADRWNHRISRWQESATSPLGPDMDPPAPIQNLSATPGPDGSVTLDWTAGPEDSSTGGAAYKYELRYSPYAIASADDFALAWNTHIHWIPEAPGTPTSYNVDTLTAGNTYYFMLVVFDEAGNASLSNVASAMAGGTGTVDIVPPSPITDLSAVAGISPGQINLSWTAPGDDGVAGTVAGYDIRVSRSSILSAMDFANARRVYSTWAYMSGGSLEFLTITLAPGTSYSISIRAYDEVGNYAVHSTQDTVITPP